MTMMDVRPDLTALTDTELALAYGHDGADHEALRAEEDRREHGRAQARAARRRRESDWHDTAHQQYLAAEDACRGVLLNRRGIAAGIDPWSLWSGNWDRVAAYASHELIEFFGTWPRQTRADWKRQQAREERTYRDELERDAGDAVRREAGEGREGAEGRGDGRGDTVPGPAARAEGAQDGSAARADAGRGAALRPGQPDVIRLEHYGDTTEIPGPARDSSCNPLNGCRHPHRVGTVRQCGNCPAAVADPDYDAGRTLAYLEQRREELRQMREARGPVRAAEPPAMPSPPPDADVSSAVAVRPAGTVMAAAKRSEVDGDEVLRYLFTYLKRFAVWGSDSEIIAAALWIAMCHARDDDGMPIWDYCARLGIFGPAGSGKSWKSRLIAKLCPSGEILIEPTKPSFIDMIADRNTVVITEADEMFYTSGKSRGILAVVNAAYERDRQNTRKQGGKVVKVTLFGHVVLDGLDTMLQATRPDLRTMLSRTIVMRSATAPEGYRPPRFDAQARAIAGQLGQRCAAWMAQEVAAGMADDVPAVPGHLGNRPFALWEPLFMVAARADACERRRRAERGEDVAEDKPGPWTIACAEACEVLEAGAPVIEDAADGELSELDRAMAEWSGDL